MVVLNIITRETYKEGYHSGCTKYHNTGDLKNIKYIMYIIVIVLNITTRETYKEGYHSGVPNIITRGT